MAGETIIGAKLSLTGATGAIKKLNAYADAMERATAATDKFAESAAAAAEKEGALADATKAQAGATRSAIAATTASTKKTEAQTAENASVIKGTKAIKEAEKAHVGFSNTVNSIAASSVGKFGKWGALGALGLSYEGIKQYQSYQYQITQLMTQAGVQQKNLAGLYAGGLTISKETGLRLATVGNQLYRIASARAGLHATNAELLSLSKQAANVSVLFNTAPGGQTEQVARIFGALATARTSGLRTVGSDRHMGALVNATVGGSDIRGSTLIGALGRGVLQSGSAVGASLPTILAWIGASTKFGAQASSSGTLIAHSLQQLATPSAQGQAAEAMFGIKQGELKSLISHQGIRAAISDFLDKIEGGGLHVTATMPSTLSQRTKGMTNRQDALTKLLSWGLNRTLLAKLTAGGPLSKNTQSALLQFIMTKAFGGARQEIPLLTLTQSHVFTSTLTYIKKHATTKNFQKDLIKAYSTPQQQQKIVEANLMASLVQVGHAIDPMWIKFLHGLLDVVNYFAKNSGALKALVGGFAGLASVGLGAVALKHVLSWIDAFKRLGAVVGPGSRFASFLNSPLFGGKGAAGVKSDLTPGRGALTSALQENVAATTRLTGVLEGTDLEGGVGGKSPLAPSVVGGATEEGGGSMSGIVAGGLMKIGMAAGLTYLVANIAKGVIGKFTHNKTGWGNLFQYAAHPTSIFNNPRSAANPISNQIATSITHQAARVTNPIKMLNAINKLRLTTHLSTAQRVAKEKQLMAVVQSGILGGTQGDLLGLLQELINHKGGKAKGIHDVNTFAGAWWQAINQGHFGALQHVLSSGQALTTGVASKVIGKTGSLTTTQILARARQARKAHGTVTLTAIHKMQLASFYASVNAQNTLTHAKTAELGFTAWLTGGMKGGVNKSRLPGPLGSTPWSDAAPKGKPLSWTQQRRSVQETLANTIAKIQGSKTDPNTKLEQESAAASKAAATLMKQAAKEHGDAAAATKVAATELSSAATALRNVHVNVNISGKEFAAVTATAISQAMARI